MIYFVLRVCLIPLAMILWVVYQFFFKKKKISELKGDISMVAFFTAVWFAVWFLLLK
jgi:hypothetical protein